MDADRRIDGLFGTGRPLVSFEFFPPKTDEGFAQLFSAIEELRTLEPSFVSVTYGAGGSTREKTVDLVDRIQNQLGIRTMAHLTCVGHTAEELTVILDRLWAKGIRNLIALRGDPPGGHGPFPAAPGGFTHAHELVTHIRGRRAFCLAVAGYPEGHPETPAWEEDQRHLAAKVAAGGAFVITQLFFDNADFYRWRDRARALGIAVPLVAGIMPILGVSQIKRFTSVIGAKIPAALLDRLERHEADAEAVHAIGVEHAIGQCRDLLAHGVDGLHFYTLNKSRATVHIRKALDFEHAR